jgi:3-isopropylmalate/(R)-2-methylmalate dehydratase small subunit
MEFCQLFFLKIKLKNYLRPQKKNKEIEIDLIDQKIHKGDNRPFDFEIESFRKECLLNGYDDIALTLKKGSKINSFEQRKKNITPWLY